MTSNSGVRVPPVYRPKPIARDVVSAAFRPVLPAQRPNIAVPPPAHRREPSQIAQRQPAPSASRPSPLRAPVPTAFRPVVQPRRGAEALAQQSASRFRVIQRLVVKVSKKHGKALNASTAVFQAEVEDAAQYLQGQGHGPVVDYYRDAGLYAWARGTTNWKADRGQRNYVVAHGDHGGIGIPVEQFADGLIARGLQTGDRVKFIVCSIAKSATSANPSYAAALKAKLKEKGADVEIIASDRYVKYSTTGKMIYSNAGGTYNEDREDTIAALKFKADQAFGLEMIRLIRESFDLTKEVIYTDNSMDSVKNYLKKRQVKAGTFAPENKTRTVEQANANLLKQLTEMVMSHSPGDIHAHLAAFFKTAKGASVKPQFVTARQAMNTTALEIWRKQAAWELKDYRNFKPEYFEPVTGHPNRAPRDNPHYAWSVF